jgi:anti-sigma regulatory factor (Ser/Thr protein kinase)
MKLLKQVVFGLFHLLAMSFACMMMMFSLRGQNIIQVQIHALDDRIGRIENLELDRRVGVIEALMVQMEDNNLLHRLTTGGMGLLLAERVASVVKREKLLEDGQK